MQSKKPETLNYKSAGVDTNAGQSFVSNITSYIKKTEKPEVLGGIGHFGGLFKANFSNYESPVLVSSTDGVGTKIELAKDSSLFRGLGRDLCAMCVNDILTLGAKPLFFLDYISTGKLEQDKLTTVVKGIVDGCLLSDMSLIGGETAEHPGTMKKNDLDLAGFSIGVADEKKIIQGDAIKPGLKIIGLSSSGPHSNGFSLVRKILENNKNLREKQSFILSLLSPTHIYTSIILPLLEDFKIKGMVHITGGGFYENIPRVLKENIGVKINLSSWEIPEVFKQLAEAGPVTQKEMFSVFNMGIGFLFFIEDEFENAVIKKINSLALNLQKDIEKILNDSKLENDLSDLEFTLLNTELVKAYSIGELIKWDSNKKITHELDDLESRIIFNN